MKDIVNYLFTLFVQYGYGAVIVGVLLDNAGIPLAGELTLLVAGSLVDNGSFGWLPTVLAATAASLFSDSIWYGIGRVGAVQLVRVYCRLSFGSSACLSRTEEMLARFGPRSLIIARFVPGFRTFAAPMAGISGIPLSRFLLYDGIGALLWSSAGVTSGLLLAKQINKIADHMEAAHYVMLALAGVLLTLFIMMKIWVRMRHGRAEIQVNNASPGDTLPIRDSSGVPGILPCIEKTLK